MHIFRVWFLPIAGPKVFCQMTKLHVCSHSALHVFGHGVRADQVAVSTCRLQDRLRTLCLPCACLVPLMAAATCRNQKRLESEELQKCVFASSGECSLSPDNKLASHRFEIPNRNDREFCGAQLTSFDRARPRREAHSHGWSWAIPP